MSIHQAPLDGAGIVTSVDTLLSTDWPEGPSPVWRCECGWTLAVHSPGRADESLSSETYRAGQHACETGHTVTLYGDDDEPDWIVRRVEG